MNENQNTSNTVSLDRRKFLRLVGSSCAVTALQSCTYAEVFTKLESSFSFDLSNPTFAPLQEVGGAVTVDGGGRKLVLIRIDINEIVALNRMCTHASCDMSFDQFGSWDAEKQELVCNCHGSFFSARGEALRGPAVSDGGPLRSYDVKFTSNDAEGKVVFDDDEELEAGTEAGAEAGAEAGTGVEAGKEAGEEAGSTGGDNDSNVPNEYRDLMNPLGDDEATINAGKAIYESNFCSGCHGGSGEGGPASGGVVFDIDRSETSDGYFYWKLAEGVEGTAMSSYKDALSEEELWQVITYIRSLGK